MTIFTSRRTIFIFIVAVLSIMVAAGGFIIGLPPFSSGEGLFTEEMGKEQENAGKSNEDNLAEKTEQENQGPASSSQPVAATDTASVINLKDEFFTNYRLDRSRVRGQQVELLQSVIADSNSDVSVRKDAQKKLMDISDSMDCEMQLEALIKAKGFTDAALFIQPESVTAILEKEGMDEAEVTAVADMISRVTGHDLEDIVVIPK